MNRTRCPNCNEPIDDPHHIACPVCRNVFREFEQTRLELLQQHREALVTEAADRAWKRLRGRIGLGFAILGALTGLGLIPIYNSLSHLIINRIAAQFEEPRIRETLDQVAQTHASKIIEGRISPAIEDAQRRIEQARQSLENSATEIKLQFNTVLRELKQANEFIMTVVAAQSDDGEAFDKLEVLAGDTSYPFAQRAADVRLNIMQERAERPSGGRYRFTWPEGIDPSKLNIEELRKEYEKAPNDQRPDIITVIWQRGDISKKERMQFLADVMEKDKSQTARVYAGDFFTKAASLRINPMESKHLVNWWRNNKDTWKDTDHRTDDFRPLR
jgi:hypothetical protein